MIAFRRAMAAMRKDEREGRRRPTTVESKDYETELKILEEDRWMKAMPAHMVRKTSDRY